MELEGNRLFSLVQLGTICLSLGALPAALEHFQAALLVSPNHASALLGAGESLLAAAGRDIRLGATGQLKAIC